MSTNVSFPTVETARMSRPFWYEDRRMYAATGGHHMGVDLVARPGSPIYAAAAGVVVEAGYKTRGGYGRRVMVQHDGFRTLYAHLKTVAVQEGDEVEAGAVVGTMGGDVQDPYRGASGGTHLHFEVILPNKPASQWRTVKTYNGWCVDPLPWLAEWFLPPALFTGRVAALDGVRVRAGVGVQSTVLYALPYKTPVSMTDLVKDEQGNTWGRLRAIRVEWAAVVWRGQMLIDMEAGQESAEEAALPGPDTDETHIAERLNEIAEHLNETMQWLEQQRNWLREEAKRFG